MPLSKQNLPVVFQGGLDQQSARQLTSPGSFHALTNCIRRKTGKVQKRFGFEALSKDILGSSTITEGVSLSSLQDELLLLNHANLYTYIPTKEYWSDRGQLLTTELSQYPVVQTNGIQSDFDMSTTNGITVTIWREEAFGGSQVRYTALDNESNSYLVYNKLLASPGIHPKIVALGNTFIVGYIDTTSGELIFGTLDSEDPTTFVPTDSFTAGTLSLFDMVVYNATTAVWTVSDTAPDIHIGYVNDAGAIGAGTTVTGRNGTATLTLNVDIPNDYIYVAHAAATGTGFLFGTLADFSVISADGVIVDINCKNHTLIVDSAGLVHINEEATGGLSGNKRTIRYITATWDGSASAPVCTTIYNMERDKFVALGSKNILYDDRLLVLLSYASNLQSTYFLYDVTNRQAIGKLLPGTGGGFMTIVANNPNSISSGLPRIEFAEGDPDSIIYGIRKKLELEAANDGTILSTSIGIQKVVANLMIEQFRTAELGANLHIAGGLPLMYDGNIVTEMNFNFYPEDITALVTGGASTFPSVGTYSYIIVYEWKDAQGQIHRSAPSVEVSATIAATTDDVLITIPFLTLTNKPDMRLVVYRTDVNGEIFYKLSEALVNDNTAITGTVGFLDTNSLGANLTSQAILYTTGDVLENEPPPANKSLFKHQNRLFAVGLENGTSLEYTKEWIYGEGVNFSSFLTVTVDSLGGDVTALGTLDDKLIIFKKDRIFVMTGRGPTDNGSQNDFSTPELVSSDIGCSEQESIAIIPDGLMFKSDKGIYIINRSLQTVYVGAGVEDYNNLDVRSAAIIDDQNEVRYVTKTGESLVYNFDFKQWSTFSNYSAESNIQLGDDYYHLKPDGTVNVETPNEYADNGDVIEMTIEFPWLSVAGIQGFQRIYFMEFLGDLLTDNHAELSLAYDFEPGYTEIVVFDTQTGDSTDVFQFRTKPARQKCEAIKIKLRDIDDIGATPGPSFTLVSGSFQVGIKDGLNRLSGNNTRGSTTA